MKLAGLVAQRPLPAGSGVNLASAPPSGIASGLQDLAQAGNTVATALARAEAEKRKYQQALDGSRAVSDALDQLDQAESTLKMGQRDPATGEVLQAPAAHDAYMPAWLKARDEITQQALERAPDAESKMVVGKLLEAPFRERQHAARKFSNDLFIGQLTTGVEDEVDRLAQRAVLDPVTMTPTGDPLWETRAMSVLAAAGGAIPEAKLRQLREKFTTQVDTAKARRLGEADPEGAIEALQTGKYRLPQDKADQLAATIETRWSARQAREDAAARRDDAAMHQAIKDNYDATVGALARDASNGTLSLARLDLWAETLKMHAPQYENLRKIITEAPKDAPSDPTVYQRLSIAINTGDRSLTRTMLAGFRAPGGGLNQKDYEHLDGKLRGEIDSRKSDAQAAEARALALQNRTDSLQQAATGRTLAAQHYNYSEGLKYAQQQLGIPDLFKLDKNREKVWADFTDDYFKRVHPMYGPNAEAAQSVLDELIPRYRVRMGDLGQRDISEIEARLRWKTKPELEAAALKYRLPEDQVKQQLDLLADLAEKKETLRQLEQSRAQEKGKGAVKRSPQKPE